MDEKYKVLAPEMMHEAMMSDSEEEGGTCQTVKYLLAFLLKLYYSIVSYN